jgi:glycosyltransferase involved in cell wall biosynthesis
MARILVLATAGLKAGQMNGQYSPRKREPANGRYPRVDYLELQRFVDVDVFNYNLYEQTRLGALFRSLETQVRSDLYLTALGLWARRHYDLVFAMSERAGIPFAALNLSPARRPLITTFKCWSERQEKVIGKLKLLPKMDRIIVHCRSMKEHLVRLGASPDRIHILHYGVDHCFFAPPPGDEQVPETIMSIGEIRSRDYATFFEAVAGLPVKVKVAASGSWYAREKERSLQTAVPENVSVTGRLPITDVRTLYGRSQFAVLPVHDVIYSAGLTGVLEAGSMARAVIATRSRGIADFVIDGETGILVEPGDVAAMRQAIAYLLAHPHEACRMGRNARQRIEEEQNLELYVEALAQFLQASL